MSGNNRGRRPSRNWADQARAAQEAGRLNAIGAPKPPFCPMLSSMVAVGASPIALPGGAEANQIRFELVKVPCALRADCMLWDDEWEQCGLRSALEMLTELGGENEGAAGNGQIEGSPGSQGSQSSQGPQGPQGPRGQESSSPGAPAQ